MQSLSNVADAEDDHGGYKRNNQQLLGSDLL